MKQPTTIAALEGVLLLFVPAIGRDLSPQSGASPDKLWLRNAI